MITRTAILVVIFAVPLTAQEKILRRTHAEKVAQYNADKKAAVAKWRNYLIERREKDLQHAIDLLAKIRTNKDLKVKERRAQTKAAAKDVREKRKDLEGFIKEAPNVSSNIVTPHIPVHGAKVGQIGKLSWIIEIDQVVSSTEAMVSVYKKKYDGQTSFWVRNIKTTGHVDDSIVVMPGLWEIIGTKKYKTAIGGTKTLFLIEPFSLEEPKEEPGTEKPKPKLRELMKSA